MAVLTSNQTLRHVTAECHTRLTTCQLIQTTLRWSLCGMAEVEVSPVVSLWSPTHMVSECVISSSSNSCYSAPVGVRSIVINPSVCLCVCLSLCVSANLRVSVCLSVSISLEPLDQMAQNFLCRSSVTMARSSSGGVAYIKYFRFYG